jgi:hypothetical protein
MGTDANRRREQTATQLMPQNQPEEIIGKNNHARCDEIRGRGLPRSPAIQVAR